MDKENPGNLIRNMEFRNLILDLELKLAYCNVPMKILMIISLYLALEPHPPSNQNSQILFKFQKLAKISLPPQYHVQSLIHIFEPQRK